MRKHLQFGAIRDVQCEAVPGWFGAEFNTNMEYYPIQDTVHIGTKFRNKLLNPSLKFGRHIITVDSLHTLIKLVTKEKHRLTETIIKQTDRQNFESVLRLSDTRVTDLLDSKVKNSQGIVFYLKILNNVLRSFLDLRMTAVERIRAIWFATFLLRIWKVDQLKKKKLQSNFIIINCYSCVEINAHRMILIILYLKKHQLDHLFCAEATFRQIGSFTSTYSTVTNASLFEISTKMSKIEFQNEIAFIKLKEFNFPRMSIESSSYYPKIDRNNQNCYYVVEKLTHWNEIITQVELAKIQTTEYAVSLEVSVEAESLISIKNIVQTSKNEETQDQHLLHLSVGHEDEDSDRLKLFPDINLQEYKQKLNPDSIDELSAYIKIRNLLGNIYIISKHTIVWILSNTQSKLSSDRLRRVMGKRN